MTVFYAADNKKILFHKYNKPINKNYFQKENLIIRKTDWTIWIFYGVLQFFI